MARTALDKPEFVIQIEAALSVWFPGRKQHGAEAEPFHEGHT